MFARFKNIWANGDVVGRDKITTNILPQPTQMDLLTSRYKVEIKDPIPTNTIIDELCHYQNSKFDDRELCEILEDAGFDYLIEEAEALKELVSKLIIKNQHYRSAQKIITFLLSEVESIFNSTIFLLKSILIIFYKLCQLKFCFHRYKLFVLAFFLQLLHM